MVLLLLMRDSFNIIMMLSRSSPAVSVIIVKSMILTYLCSTYIYTHTATLRNILRRKEEPGGCTNVASEYLS